MKITDAFLGEHGVFYAQLDHFEAALEADDLECVQRRAALLAAALEPHAHLENELLFDPVQERLGGGAAGVLDVMRAEHDEIEAALAEIRATRDLRRAREILVEMIRTTRDHFEKEERVAFPLAEEMLAEAELRKLGALWAERRGVRLLPPAIPTRPTPPTPHEG